MKTFINPDRENWSALVQRPQFDLELLEDSVKQILARVKKSGDQALRELTAKFDSVKLDAISVSEIEIQNSGRLVSLQLKDAIQIAAANIKKIHAAQMQPVSKIVTTSGVTCWRKALPISKVGIYIPGGTAPLFSTVLMLGIPARLAGCDEIILCSPPDASGKIDPAIVYAAHLIGITKIYNVGGAQAIAAMAYGTESIPKVFKIFGPGNQYVTKAKQLVSYDGTAIDLPAGPSEILVLADETANASFVAADLLSQAEHGVDSQVTLVVTCELLLKQVLAQVCEQIATLPRKDIATKALATSQALYFETIKTSIDFINEYAPEHLIINTKNADDVAERVMNAGSVFIGNYSPEAIGDYASGTNHTLPTNGSAKIYSGVSLESFTKWITFQKLTEEGIKNLGPTVECMAEAEGLEAHRRAVAIRLNQLKMTSND
jgi:histidinol dehydrogenase